MNLPEIIHQLDPADLTGIVTRFGITPEQLGTHLSQEHIFVQNYRALSKRYRQIYDFLYLNSPEIAVAELRKKFNLNRNDFKLFEERGLLFVLPSLVTPEKLVIPQEYLFFTEIPLADENSLVTVFRNYQATRLFKVANHYRIQPQPNFSQFASELYTHIIQNAATELRNLSPVEQEILEAVMNFGGSMGFEYFTRKFFPQINAFHAKHRVPMDDFLGLNQLGKPTDLQLLFIRCFLVFTTGTLLKVAVPAEIYPILAQPFLEIRDQGKQALIHQLHSTPQIKLQSRAQQADNDLKKLLLLIENQAPRMTSGGDPFKTDFRRMLELLGAEKKYWLFLIEYARWLGILTGDNRHYQTAPEAVNFFHLSANERCLLAVKFLKESLCTKEETDEPRDRAIQDFTLKLLTDWRKEAFRTDLSYEYAGLLPEFRQLFEDFQPYQAAFNKKILFMLKRYFWLGLVDATPNFELVHFSTAGQYAFGGWYTRFQQLATVEDKFFVQPSGEIIADSNIPFETLLQLARLCEIVSMDVAIRFQISQQQIISFVQQGATIQQVFDFFREKSKTPLPQTLEFLLNDIAQKEGEVELIPVSGYLQFKDKQLFESVKVLLHDYILTILQDEFIFLKPNIELGYVEKLIKQKGLFIRAQSPKIMGGKENESRFSALLTTIEPPPFNSDDLPFANPAVERAEIRQLLHFAIAQQITVKMEYENDSFSNTLRKVDPLRMNENILEAYCHSREMNRAFLIDRIRHAELFR